MSTAGFHITEDCAEVYLQNESGMEFLQLARRLHDYLQQGQRLPARSLFEATDDCKEISREAFDALAKHRMENTGEVSGLFELDFDARTISALNIMDGWKVYAMQDVADAAEQAFQEAEISEDARWRVFLDRLEGKEMTYEPPAMEMQLSGHSRARTRQKPQNRTSRRRAGGVAETANAEEASLQAASGRKQSRKRRSRRKGLALFCASPSTSAHSAGSFTGSATGVVKWLFRWAVGTETEKAS